ncbi:dihydrofolate reductase family protein [Aeromicrobium sp.]|uniref:dihydrofolate reductase family protein n=1 Tax=Aeromicrobium sp. TaxID=1871063 RepID=UPI002FC85D01
MRPLRYSINLTLDGCCDHTAVKATEDIHRFATEMIGQADALLFGRVTYQMMEAAWRTPSPDLPDWTAPFAETINAARKYVVTSTLDDVDWNAEIVHGDLATFVEDLKQQPGEAIYTGSVMLPMALAELGLIDEYVFLVHPRLAGHGRTLFEGLAEHVDLKLTGTKEYGSGAVALSYVPA